MKHKPHVFVNTQRSRERYVTDRFCQPVLTISVFYLDTKTYWWYIKLLNLMKWHTSEKVS